MKTFDATLETHPYLCNLSSSLLSSPLLSSPLLSSSLLSSSLLSSPLLSSPLLSSPLLSSPLLFIPPMEDTVTLASIKDMLQKYSSKKSLFKDSSIISKINDSCTKITNCVIKDEDKNLLLILKKCSEDIRLLKLQNNKIEASECVECLIILNRIKKDIERIRKENTGIRSKIWMCRLGLIPVVLLLGYIVSRTVFY